MRIDFNSKALAELVLMPELLPMIQQKVDAIAAASGEGYYPHVNPGYRRHRGAVVAGSPRAARDNRKHNTLVRNLSAGG